MKPEAAAWLEKAEEHLDAALVLLKGGHYPQSIFLSEQAVETLLKTIWVERASEGVPPRTHDLVFLAKDLNLDISEDQLEFLRALSEQYMPTRYADIPAEYTEESAENYYRKGQEIFSWLRRLLS